MGTHQRHWIPKTCVFVKKWKFINIFFIKANKTTTKNKINKTPLQQKQNQNKQTNKEKNKVISSKKESFDTWELWIRMYTSAQIPKTCVFVKKWKSINIFFIKANKTTTKNKINKTPLQQKQNQNKQRKKQGNIK